MFCTHCGAQINDGSVFCTACGKSQQQSGGAPAMTQAPTPVTSALPLQFGTGNENVVPHVQQAFQSKAEFAGSTKIFSGLFTDVAVSESGYIGLYRPYVAPGVAKVAFIKTKTKEKPAYFEFFHISQINDIDITIDETTETSVSGGAGGAIVGGLLGGTMGSIIGSAATSGKVKERTTINGIDLVLDVKDFQNPRRVIPLWRPFSTGENEWYPQSLEIAVQKECGADPSEGPDWINIATKRYGGLLKIGALSTRLKSEFYNDGNPPIEVVDALSIALKHTTNAFAEAEATSFAVSTQTVVQQASAADELAKFKSLLDGGILTQAEFDEKKKQLLRL